MMFIVLYLYCCCHVHVSAWRTCRLNIEGEQTRPAKDRNQLYFLFPLKLMFHHLLFKAEQEERGNFSPIADGHHSSSGVPWLVQLMTQTRLATASLQVWHFQFTAAERNNTPTTKWKHSEDPVKRSSFSLISTTRCICTAASSGEICGAPQIGGGLLEPGTGTMWVPEPRGESHGGWYEGSCKA